jgi:hypothetical protein
LLNDFLPKPAVIASNLPSTAQVTALKQAASGRTIVHVLYFPLTRRATDIDIIEEPGLLEKVQLRVRLDQQPTKATLVPQGVEVPFVYQNGYAAFELSRVSGHQAVALA